MSSIILFYSISISKISTTIRNQVIKDYGKGKWAGFRQRMDYGCILDYCLREKIEFVYARCFMNANPFLVRFFKQLKCAGIKAVTEIPTYPYDKEFTGSSDWNMKLDLWLDKLYRCKLYRQQNAVVTFSDAEDIFGQRTIRISNGVDFDSIPLHQPSTIYDQSSAIHLIGVAEVHFWHGFDRLIAGIGEYYKQGGKREVYFHILIYFSQRYLRRAGIASVPLSLSRRSGTRWQPAQHRHVRRGRRRGSVPVRRRHPRR